MNTFKIGNHIFFALSFIDATHAAVNKARELFEAGATREAKALHREALDLQRIERDAWPERTARTPIRLASRFRRPGR